MCRYRSRLPSAALAILLLLAPPVSASDTRCDRPVAELLPIVDRMERSWSAVTDYTARLVKTERFVDGTLTRERALIRFRKPNLVHLRVTDGPNAGAVLLFPKPGTDDVILARPGGVSGSVAGFLVNLPAIGELVPHEFALDDPRLMNGQHHPLPDATLAGMIRLISINVRTAAGRLEGGTCFHDTEVVDGHRSAKFEVRLPAEEGFWHTAAAGESLWSIGEDYAQDRYVIRYNNPSIERWDDLSAGTRIFIPRYYAPRAMVWVSELVDLPVRLQMFDSDARLYESYSNVGLRVDVGLSNGDFDPARHGFPGEGIPESGPPDGAAGTR